MYCWRLWERGERRISGHRSMAKRVMGVPKISGPALCRKDRKSGTDLRWVKREASENWPEIPNSFPPSDSYSKGGGDEQQMRRCSAFLPRSTKPPGENLSWLRKTEKETAQKGAQQPSSLRASPKRIWEFRLNHWRVQSCGAVATFSKMLSPAPRPSGLFLKGERFRRN